MNNLRTYIRSTLVEALKFNPTETETIERKIPIYLEETEDEAASVLSRMINKGSHTAFDVPESSQQFAFSRIELDLVIPLMIDARPGKRPPSKRVRERWVKHLLASYPEVQRLHSDLIEWHSFAFTLLVGDDELANELKTIASSGPQQFVQAYELGSSLL